MHDFHSGKKSQTNGLTCDRKSPGNGGLGSDNDSDGRDKNKRINTPRAKLLEKRIGNGCGIRKQQTALPQIIQRQGGKNQHKPGTPDRAGTKMSHIRIQGFRSGKSQYDSTQCDKSDRGIIMNELPGI